MYRRYRRKWGTTQNFHRFITLVGLLAQVGLEWCLSYRSEKDTAETMAWHFMAFTFMALLAAFIVSFGSSLRPR